MSRKKIVRIAGLARSVAFLIGIIGVPERIAGLLEPMGGGGAMLYASGVHTRARINPHRAASRKHLPLLMFMSLALILWLAFPAQASGTTTTRVSVSSSGAQGNAESDTISVADDDVHVTFDSLASNLVAGDSNGSFDVFVKNLSTRAISLVSSSYRGGSSDGDSFVPAISGNGRYVAFESTADNLVRGDTNGASDVFVRNLVSGKTERVSVSSSDTQGNSDSFEASISDDGRYVAFFSFADNLVPGDTNSAADVFVRDRAAETTTRVSVATDGSQLNEDSFAKGGVSISDDGHRVVFESGDDPIDGDTNGHRDVFLRDLTAGTTSLVSVSSSDEQGNADSIVPAISGNGSAVAFSSGATNFAPAANSNGPKIDLFVRDLPNGSTRLVSETDDSKLSTHNTCCSKALSDDGQKIAFSSLANDLVPGDTNHVLDVFFEDLSASKIVRASVSTSGSQANGSSGNAAISGDGKFVGFASVADNLVPGDTNGTFDVFMRGPMI